MYANTSGVMSARDIEDVIKENKLTPKLLKASMMKQITWVGQWIGYDYETIAINKKWADGLCFDGTMAWSIDFSNDNGAGSSNKPSQAADGSCGPKNGDAMCGSWPAGNCCSASGWCGSGDVYCGNGCQSSECITGGTTSDVTITIAIIIVVPSLTTNMIPVSNFVWTKTKTNITYLWSSVSFPPVVLTARSTTVTKVSRTITIPPVIWTYSPEAGPPTRRTTPVAPASFRASAKP